MNPPSWQPEPPKMPNDAYKQMEGYEKLTGFERWLGNAFQSSIPKAVEDVKEFLPDPIEKAVFGIGNAAIKFLGLFDFMEEGIERSSGVIRQYKLARETGTEDDFFNNLGDAWAAGNMFYDISNAPLPGKGAKWQDPQIPFHFEFQGTSELPEIRRKITELTNQGVGRKEALEQVKSEYYSDMGALAIRAIKQDIAGHILFSPFLIAQAMGYAPVDIIKKASVVAGNKYLPGTLEHLDDALRAAQKADDLDEVARLTDEIAKIKKLEPLTSGDKAAMFLTGNYPEPLGEAGKMQKALYYLGNQLAHSDSKALKAWQRLNPFSLTPEARAHEWMNRIDNYLGTHVLAQGDPHKIVQDLTEMASQATSGKLSAMSVTSDGRMIQSFLRSGELGAQQLLGDFVATSQDGKLLMQLADRLNIKAPDLIDDIADGKTAKILQRLAGPQNERLVAALTDDVFKRLGALKGKPYTPELFRYTLHNQMLDQMAQLGIVQFGVKNRGLIQKWNSFLKAGETLAFLRINPTFAARNWINNEFTMIARGVGGDFFGNGADDLASLVDKLNFTPLRANQAFTMAALEGDTVAEIGQAAQKTIAKQLQGDAIWLDKWAKKINDAELGIFDFGKLAQRAESAASRKAITKGYTRAWRQFWTPENFTSASKFLPQEVIRELGEDAIGQLDNLLADAHSLDDITNILTNIDKVDLNRTVSGAISDVETSLGIKLSNQFEDFEIEKIRDGLSRAMNAKSRNEVREIFDELNESAIKKIVEESNARLQTKLDMFEGLVEAERGMALIDITEELTNQLDIFEYLHSSGMSRFRPQDVSPDVKDIYWPMWFDQHQQHFAIVNDRIDAAIDGVRAGGKNIDLNLDQGLTILQRKRKNWDDFFEWRNSEYKLFRAGESKFNKMDDGWEQLVEEINKKYIIAADKDMAAIKRIDDIMTEAVRINNPELADGFAGWRAAIRQWKIKDRSLTRTYTYGMKTGDPMVAGMTYEDFWRLRGELQLELGELKNRGYAMMEGDANELAYFAQSPVLSDIEQDVAEAMTRGDIRVAERLAKDLEGNVSSIRASQHMSPELGPMFPNEAREEQWFSRNFWTLKELEEQAASKIGQPAARLDVSDYARGELEKFLTGAQREMADAQYGSLQMAEYYRDAALLNYNRKMNYDTWLGTFMPFEFWMTHSLGQWAIQSMNRPAMLTFYLRLREMQDRISIQDDSFPSRLRGKFRIQVPPYLGMQDWMGDSLFVDPLNWALPFGQMSMPYQMALQRGLSNEGRVERELDRMVIAGDITRAEADEAMASRSGQAFADAMANIQSVDGEKTDNYELLSSLSSPHAPYDIAYKALTGQPESIGPFLPATFTANRFMGMFGVDWPHEKMNAPARIRRWMGLPGFDQWEDYRVERMLSNMSATGEITPEQASRAMIEHSGIAWELARKKAAKEYAGGPWWVTFLKTVGLPAYIYPEGEQHQRQLSDDFEKAMEAYEAGDTESYNRFFDQNPEFANRLALFDEPEERMQKFMVGEVWNLYSELQSVDKSIARDMLGDEFTMRFLDKDTRNYDAIPTEQLQMWAKMLGGDPPGTMSEAFPITFAPPEIASGAQVFYDTRATNFPNFYDLQSKYFMLNDSARKQYLVEHPELKQYWDWRRDFLKRNPTIAPYIDDNFEPNYGSVQEMEQAFAQEPQFGRAEWYNYLGGETLRLVLGVYNDANLDLPADVKEYIEGQASKIGMSFDELLQAVGTSQ